MSDASSFRPDARAPRGFADRRGPDLALERRIVEAVSGVYARWGFEPLATSAFEYADALGKFLPDADRPNAGVFALQDDDDQWMALRYDLTAPLARFAAERWETLPKPFRRYAVGPVWRNEKPGPGRFREFIQCDADTVGSDRPEADAEVVAMALEGFAAAGLGQGRIVMKINSRRLLDGLLDGVGVTSAGQRLAVLRALDKLDRLGPAGVEALLGEGRLDESGDFTRGAGLARPAIDAVMAYLATAGSESRTAFLDALSGSVAARGAEAALEDLARIDGALAALGVKDADARFDATVVRGLEYYTGAVFEAELALSLKDERGRPVQFGSVGGGGRYDDLIARFTGEPVPATGISFGVSRLASALALAGEAPGEAVRGPVVVIVLDEAFMADYLAVARQLREAGLDAEVYLGRSGLKAQMKYADRRNSPVAVIIGEDERAAGQVTLKDLDLGRALAKGITDNAAWRGDRPGQRTVARADMVQAIGTIVAQAAPGR